MVFLIWTWESHTPRCPGPRLEMSQDDERCPVIHFKTKKIFQRGHGQRGDTKNIVKTVSLQIREKFTNFLWIKRGGIEMNQAEDEKISRNGTFYFRMIFQLEVKKTI